MIRCPNCITWLPSIIKSGGSTLSSFLMPNLLTLSAISFFRSQPRAHDHSSSTSGSCSRQTALSDQVYIRMLKHSHTKRNNLEVRGGPEGSGLTLFIYLSMSSVLQSQMKYNKQIYIYKHSPTAVVSE